MSMMHIDTVSATGQRPFVDLQDLVCSATSTTNAEATINARTIGDVTCRINGTVTSNHNWIEPTWAGPGVPSYQVMRGASAPFDLDTNPGYGPLAGVWQDVGNLAFWGFQTSDIQLVTATFLVSIRQGTGPVIDTATWTIQINRTAGGGGGGGGGCFTGNMLVLMADGTEKPIANIFAGEMVMSFDTETNKLVSAKVDDVMVPRICDIYEIKLSNGKVIETTSEHPFRTADGRWANIDPEATYRPAAGGANVKPYVGGPLYQMHEGMLLHGIEGNAKVVKIIDTGRKETVYHLSRVGSSHNFFVEGMCVHNIFTEIK